MAFNALLALVVAKEFHVCINSASHHVQLHCTSFGNIAASLGAGVNVRASRFGKNLTSMYICAAIEDSVLQ